MMRARALTIIRVIQENCAESKAKQVGGGEITDYLGRKQHFFLYTGHVLLSSMREWSCCSPHKTKEQKATPQYFVIVSPAAAGATKNLRRFGQSIKRVVREVKEESTGKPALNRCVIKGFWGRVSHCLVTKFVRSNAASMDSKWSGLLINWRPPMSYPISLPHSLFRSIPKNERLVFIS